MTKFFLLRIFWALPYIMQVSLNLEGKSNRPMLPLSIPTKSLRPTPTSLEHV